MKKLWKWKNLTLPLLSLTVSMSAALSGCGREAFVPVSTTNNQTAPGNFTVPPKVDILLVQDDTGGMQELYSQIRDQMPGFLAGLESKNWDYHFAVVPLTTDQAITQVLASKYDSNWGDQWKPPYPGAAATAAGMVSSSVFRTPERFTGFLSGDAITNALMGQEPGFETIRLALTQRVNGTGFLRSDALLVVFVISNGEDTSGVSISCTRLGYPAEMKWPCPDSLTTSFESYRSAFAALKTPSNQLKFFAAVSPYKGTCRSNNAFAGTRYEDMALALNGAKYDVCSQQVSSILEALSSQLQAEKLRLRTRYLFVEREPDVTSIQVVKYVGGSAAIGETLPQDAANGWTYAGYVQNVYAIDSPVPMNLSSGYAIELHGSAMLTGDDTASVTFSGAGSTTTTTH